MKGISKSFPGVRALQGVDLDLSAGETLALVGENGAGKSTLIKVLSGAHRPDGGVIRIAGAAASIAGPADAQRAGIAVIYQEFNLVPSLCARENIFLGHERTRAGFVRRREEQRQARELFQRIGVEINPEIPCQELTTAQQQVVEIAKALSLNARVIVMDEPSATLTPQEVGRLFGVIRDLKAQGIGVIYISHRLDEVFEIGDRVMVMRDGCHIGTLPVSEVTRENLIEMMVGRKLDHEFPKQPAPIGDEILSVSNLSRGRHVRDVSFNMRRGEILGMTGLVGAGRTETARLIFGADRPDSGTIHLEGRPLPHRGPREAIRAGICLLTEDRKSQGLVLARSCRENFGLPNLPGLSRYGFVRMSRERAQFGHYVQALRIRLRDQEQAAQDLSGGNQQKVVLAKWLERNSKVIIFDEPTRGIDVGAKYEIYLLMNDLARQGKAILMITSELPEALGMSNRILVMRDGRISGEVTDMKTATQEQLLHLAAR
ncbi:MAG: sugar ABC transporter ATP-binding protein [Candidatus Sumerlaeota bacterium]|nr:sugar ABC transporter ATP-binding protein [Candidatus Sumerlaeota bacterium]